jgi:UDP-N-acetylmuramoylalanine--D-glutamate ligase
MKSTELFIDLNKKNTFKNILIVGLGKSGISSAKYISKFKKFFGNKISLGVYDKFKSIDEQKSLLKDLEIDNFHTGIFEARMCKQNSLIVLSPGIDPNEVICDGMVVNDIFLFLDYINRISSHLSQIKIVGITGTNGKTTTCYFLEHLMKSAELVAHIAGNIGNSPLDLIDNLKEGDTVILELSSFQLRLFIDILFPRKLDIGIFLNITPDHLDIHKNMDEYLNSKKVLLYNSERTIINRDLGEEFVEEFNDITLSCSSYIPDEHKKSKSLISYDLINKNGKKYIQDNREFILPIAKLNVPGKHNIFNVMAGIAALRCLEIKFYDYEKTFSSFQGISHRIEWIKNINDVDYFNDSKGTNVASTIAALASFDNKRIILIAGGDVKNQNLLPLKDSIKNNVKALILIGRDANLFLENFKDIDSIEIAICQSMKEAVTKAYSFANQGEVVLLSPASASFDMYSNYIERGNHFKDIVHQIL